MKQSIKTLKKVRTLEDLRATQRRELLWLIIPLLLVVVIGLWITSRVVQPAPPGQIIMSTGSESGAYHLFGKRYAAHLIRSGIKLELKTSNGSEDNFKRILDAQSGVQVTLMQGGLPNDEDLSDIISLGRVFLQPIWVFYRGTDELTSVTELKGKRISPGPTGSGTRLLAGKILKASGIDETTATYKSLSVAASASALRKGDVDAIFLALAPSTPLITELLNDPSIKLMHFATAEALTRKFPYLTRITLPRGAIDLVKNVPPRDFDLVANEAALVVRADLHPAVVALLAETAKKTHVGGGLFQRVGTYPKLIDPEFAMSEDAERYYRSGPTFLQRFLPFWLANFLQRMALLLVPVATIALPLFKLIPALFRWRHNQRLLHWFGQIKQLEDRIVADPERTELEPQRAELSRITAGIDAVPMPLGMAVQYYELRAALDLVRARLG